MDLAVAVGVIAVDGSKSAVAAAGPTLTAADPTDPRFDLVTVTGGIVTVTTGTPAAVPLVPPLAAGDVALAFVYVPAAAASVGATEITDKRVLVNPGPSPCFVSAMAVALG